MPVRSGIRSFLFASGESGHFKSCFTVGLAERLIAAAAKQSAEKCRFLAFLTAQAHPIGPKPGPPGTPVARLRKVRNDKDKGLSGAAEAAPFQIRIRTRDFQQAVKPRWLSAFNRSAEALHPSPRKPRGLGTPALRHPKSAIAKRERSRIRDV